MHFPEMSERQGLPAELAELHSSPPQPELTHSSLSCLEFQQVGDRGNDERSLLVDTSNVEMLTS